MKVYIIVREDILTASQKAVQAAHAVAELCLKEDVKEWGVHHKTMVLLGLKQGWKMEETYHGLINSKKAIFYEPDLKNQPTAIAFLAENFEPITKKLQLIKER